jgi:hypothetical protein
MLPLSTVTAPARKTHQKMLSGSGPEEWTGKMADLYRRMKGVRDTAALQLPFSGMDAHRNPSIRGKHCGETLWITWPSLAKSAARASFSL